MTKLYFIRHGKTEWNEEGRYQGARGDSPLLKESYAEIHALAHHLSLTPFRHIYVSPVRRARVTGSTLQHDLDDLQGHATPLSIASRLREFNLGKMEGMRFSDVQKRYPREFEDFRNHPDQYDPRQIQGESFPQLIQRMRPTIARITDIYRQPTDNVLIVSHGAALNALINTLLGADLKDLRKRGGLSNTSTTILETLDLGQSFKLLKWNDTSYIARHLDPTDTI
ncbi:histidine phosphatase family protein [Pediococcus siamensis]|uniref:histidine phosphatase family protein n=1 Tax=Pediococcus siamensis TaxID=381829 RepID=UPI00399F3064